MTRMSKCFVSFLLGSGMFISSTNSVFAANQSFTEKVSNEFVTYKNKLSNEYKDFELSVTKEYEEYQEDEFNAYEQFSKQAKLDGEKLNQILNEDFDKLQNYFGGNESYTGKLRDYQNKISPDYLGSPMQQYTKSVNSNYLNSFMMKFKNSINENYLNSPMMKYKNAVNENYMNSPMMAYKNAVNENYLNSPMSKLKNGSNENFLNSIMYQYKKGKIGQQEASKKWKALFQKESQTIEAVKSKSTRNIQQISETTQAQIIKQKYETVNGIIKQREQTLEAINKLRKDYFGEELSVDALIPDLGKINVIIDGEWQSYKQPPILMNGATLVPMRAIFEKLGAEVGWDAKKQSISARKGRLTVSLVLNKNKATIDGKTLTLSAAPRLINGNTMVPLRFVSESLGSDVEWDGLNKTVFIQAK